MSETYYPQSESPAPTMTVGQLIERLRQFSPDELVIFRSPRYGCFGSNQAYTIDAVARETLELSLRDLREQCGFTQQQIAEALEMAQGVFSRLERRDDHLVSTLRKVVKALGGELEVTARFKNKLVKIV